MKINFIYIPIIFLIFILFLSLERKKIQSLEIDLEKTKKSLDSIQKVSDTLYNNLYPCEIQLNRYEVAHQIFLKRNPKAASQFSDIISEETE